MNFGTGLHLVSAVLGACLALAVVGAVVSGGGIGQVFVAFVIGGICYAHLTAAADVERKRAEKPEGNANGKE